jgi:arsenate reductase
MRIYHNPRCSKSRQTLDLLRQNGVEPEIIDYLVNVPTESELRELVKMLGIHPEELVRKGEQEYKDLFKGRKLSEAKWITAMVQHPRLIERPIVVKNKKAVLERPPENALKLL